MYTIGYCKDVFGMIFFLIYSIICYWVEDINAYKPLLLLALISAFCIDGMFSLSPNYHHAPIGKNILTLVVFGAAVIQMGISVYFFNLLFIEPLNH